MATNHLNPGGKTFPAELEAELKTIAADGDAADIEISKLHEKLYAPIYKKRSEIIKKIPGFWHQVLINYLGTNMFIDDVDQEALSYVTDIKVTRDTEDLRKATITFEFKENPYFTNKELTRVFEASPEAPAIVDFTPTEDWTSKKVSIDWKDDEHNLVKLRPGNHGADADDFEPGSFFATLFDTDKDDVCNTIAHGIVEDLYSNALDIYTGEYVGGGFDSDEFDDDDDDEEDDDDEAEEIDLEAPPKKKTKTN